MLGTNEINYLHRLSDSESKLRIGNIVKYNPPCIIVTAHEEELMYLPQYCTEEKFLCFVRMHLPMSLLEN